MPGAARRRGVSRLVVFAAGLLAFAALGGIAAWWARLPSVQGDASLERLDVYGEVPPFALTERSGRRVTRDDLRGLVWIADLIYTECTDTCPLQSRRLAEIQDAFAAAADLRLVSISVAPEHDTPAVLERYAMRHGATERWWFLTGNSRAIHCLARMGFRLSVADPGEPAPPDCGHARRFFAPRAAWAHHDSAADSKRLVLHSARLVLVDRAARIRAYHLATDLDSLRRLRTNIRRLLAEEPRG